jgi:hypothetical protein
MTVARSPATDTMNAIPVWQARGGFGLIQKIAASGWAGSGIGRVTEEGERHDYEANHRRPA